MRIDQRKRKCNQEIQTISENNEKRSKFSDWSENGRTRERKKVPIEGRNGGRVKLGICSMGGGGEVFMEVLGWSSFRFYSGGGGEDGGV